MSKKVFLTPQILLEMEGTPIMKPRGGSSSRQVPAPAPAAAPPQQTPVAAAGTPPPQAAAPQAMAPAAAPARPVMAVSSAPTLQQIHRPDVKPMPDRHAESHAAFHDQSNKFKAIRGLHSANATFHAETESGHDYVIKPHSGADNGHEPEKWASRNKAANMVLHHMGAGHMGAEGFHAQVPTEDRHGKGVKSPPAGPGDSPAKQRKMISTHMGQDAYVVRFNPDVARVNASDPDDLAKVDGNHRATGLVHHILFGNADGHHGNVLIDKKNKHPVLIDHDLTLNSIHNDGGRRGHPDDNPHGKDALMSVFHPGEDLDYRHGETTDPLTGQKTKMGEVGHDFSRISPHVHNTIAWLAAGGHHGSEEEGGLGLDPDDAQELQNNARELMLHGLEGTLENRWNKPTYIKQREMDAVDQDAPTRDPAGEVAY